MKKLPMTLAAAGLAVGLVVTGSVAANAVTFPALSCASSPNGHYVGVGIQISGTATLAVVYFTSWGHTYPYSSTLVTRNFAAPTSYSTNSYATAAGGTTGWGANGCYTSPRS